MSDLRIDQPRVTDTQTYYAHIYSELLAVKGICSPYALHTVRDNDPKVEYDLFERDILVDRNTGLIFPTLIPKGINLIIDASQIDYYSLYFNYLYGRDNPIDAFRNRKDFDEISIGNELIKRTLWQDGGTIVLAKANPRESERVSINLEISVWPHARTSALQVVCNALPNDYHETLYLHEKGTTKEITEGKDVTPEVLTNRVRLLSQLARYKHLLLHSLEVRDFNEILRSGLPITPQNFLK